MLTILIVEDDEGVRRAAETILRREGYNVCMPIAPPYGEGALKLLETEQIDAVLLDLLLGRGFDGFELARRMKAHPEWRHIPIFLTSGLDEGEINRRAMEYAFLGLRTFNVGKPFDAELLFAKLAELSATR